MAPDTARPARYHAVLIGIDDYPQSPLKSCVRDVEIVARAIENTIDPSRLQCYIYAAGRQLDEKTAKSDNLRVVQRPTLHNIIECLKNIPHDAEPGDFVYIHFSGHGTRMNPKFDYSNQQTGDLALVLLASGESSETDLKGPRLAGLIKKMIEKELVITVVLDCCFSGSVYRESVNVDEGGDIRYLPSRHQPTQSAKQDDDVDLSSNNAPSKGSLRSASMNDNWLLRPDKYTILAACGPLEKAKGAAITEIGDKQVRNGALSYLLVQALEKFGLSMRHKDIFRYLAAQFWELGRRQNPVLYGNDDQAFFGPPQPEWASRLIGLAIHEGSLRLLAGRAHGVRDGDSVGLYTLEAIKGQGMVETIVRVLDSRPLTSVLDTSSTTAELRAFLAARLMTSSTLSQLHISWAGSAGPEVELKAALLSRSLSMHKNDREAKPNFAIAQDLEGKYSITHGENENLLPNLQYRLTRADDVCDVLEHLARFQMVEQLRRETESALNFRVWLKVGDELIPPFKPIEVRDDDSIELQIKNTGDIKLYVYVLYLGATWEVQCLHKATHAVIYPRESSQSNINTKKKSTVSKKIRMNVPMALRKQRRIKDTIKVFITNQSTNFKCLELSRLDELMGKFSHKHNQTDDGVLRDLSRSPPIDDDEDWVGLNFPIYTTCGDP
ncbi:uncharacterized protein B0I36DRAFT_369175 [Microdochium trichocladiopsis]|uniref:Peptidase C14 caspase domain-containing protein n=1 Tax=Microdochium trichocladiopsis TaxID=1682393 RepID=A0A9P9BG13_9PEZI|nr:uncharacterized protein B0I36DRAFT_369175 [Microdochium trichocladiopsis]KAH7014189.1 hypothetical protein B0I36DRAFT_369175 [Microdochium trichocladiopsis]